ncbi:MAG: DUF4139 domain-containing protein [Chitinophagales bacterium]
MKFSSFVWNLLFTLFLLQSFNLQAAPTKASTNIKGVTVYQQKAKITRTAQATIPAGTSDILLKDLSSKIDGQSLQVTLNDGIKLLSATFQIDYLNDPKKSAAIENLEDSLKLVQFELDWVNRQIEVYQSEEKLMDMNSQKVGTETKGLSAQDLKEVMTFYRKQLMEIKKERLNLDRERGKLQNSATRLQKQLQQVISEKTKAIGEVLLKVVSKTPTTAKIEFSYIVENAGWKPIYDIRAANIEEPVTLSYKANIFQHTGQDWNNIDLTVSTGNPSKSNDRPILSPSYLAFAQPYNNSSLGQKKLKMPNYQMMNSMQLSDKDMRENMYGMDETEKLGYSEDRTKEEVDVVLNQNQLNLSFEVKLKQSIPTDGQYHLVDLKDYEIDAEYDYHTVPKLDKGAFLLAKITDWGNLNLLAGNANIFFDDTYIGQSFINPATTADTLLLSFGRDEQIQVKRMELNDLSETNFLGNKRTETKTYEISVRNNKGTTAHIEILDQIPISQNEDIEVKLIGKDGAEYTQKYGKLLWRLDIPAGQTKKIKLEYSVKYPKGRLVAGL